MINFFGPNAKYQGLVGATCYLFGRSYTIHIFPRVNTHRWGFDSMINGEIGYTKAFDLGPLFSICWSG